MEIQKLKNEEGEFVMGLRTEEVKHYTKIETSCHFFRVDEDKLDELIDRVEKLKEEKKHRRADLEIESYVDKNLKTKPKILLTRADRALQRDGAFIHCKVELFGYKDLTKKELSEDTTEDSEQASLSSNKSTEQESMESDLKRKAMVKAKLAKAKKNVPAKNKDMSGVESEGRTAQGKEKAKA